MQYISQLNIIQNEFQINKEKLRNDFYSIKNTELRNQIFKT